MAGQGRERESGKEPDCGQIAQRDPKNINIKWLTPFNSFLILRPHFQIRTGRSVSGLSHFLIVSPQMLDNPPAEFRRVYSVGVRTFGEIGSQFGPEKSSLR